MDARSLLRAKKAEARIEHPYASYSAAGQLRCSVCAVPVKQWDAHLLTKQHRTSVAREKASQAKVKRPAPEAAEPETKRAKIEQTPDDEDEDDGPPGLPAGFFSSANKPAAQPGIVTESQADADTDSGPSEPAPKTGDLELDDFLSSLNDDNEPAPSAVPIAPLAPVKKYQPTSSAGIGVASYEAAPVRIAPKEEEVAAEEPEPEESEEDRRKRLEREEREEIMGRLEEEERAQEDADSRVTSLKLRMEMLKKKREGRQAKPKKKAEETNGA